MKLFSEYKGLRKEIYIIFYGRIVSSMGALIWPMLTLILRNKIGMAASDIASLMFIMGVIGIPAMLAGGKLADRFNKRNIIVFCDLITIAAFLVCGFIDIDMNFIYIFFFASIFQSIEMPSYDAIVADFTSPEDRSRAYSLNYLGGNIGLILAPTIGGFLFESHLNLAFLINGVMIAMSTLLFFLFIKPNAEKVVSENTNHHEANVENVSAVRILLDRPVVIFFILLSSLSMLVYSQFGYLIPLNYESLYGADGATIYGTIVSMNGLVVIVFTPLFTRFLRRWADLSRVIVGQALIVAGLAMYMVIQGMLPLYYVSIIIFTFGEIVNTISLQPYLSKRIPANFRGRINSFYMIFRSVFQSLAQIGVGFLFDNYSISFTWCIISIVGGIVVVGYMVLRKMDYRAYPDLNRN